MHLVAYNIPIMVYFAVENIFIYSNQKNLLRCIPVWTDTKYIDFKCSSILFFLFYKLFW